jgi:O-antigen/teichoic acid export membrane protein
MILNVVLNLILIPRHFAFGSAYASLITQILTGATQVILAIAIFKLKINLRLIFQLLMFTGVVVVLGSLSKSIETWVTGYLAMIFASVLFAFVLKLFNLRDLYQIIRYE